MRRALLVLLSAAALVAIYAYFRPQPTETPMPAQSNAAAPPRAEFELTVAGGKLVSGPAVIQVLRGTEVTIRIHSDRAEELHLHGYDLHAQIPAGEPVELKFTAERTGRFEYELHGSHRELGALEVRPE